MHSLLPPHPCIEVALATQRHEVDSVLHVISEHYLNLNELFIGALCAWNISCLFRWKLINPTTTNVQYHRRVEIVVVVP